MNAARIHQYGGPGVLSYEEVPCPEPSGLTMDVIQSRCKRPERCLIGQLEQAVKVEAGKSSARLRSADAKEAITAFFEKRPPDFTRARNPAAAVKPSQSREKPKRSPREQHHARYAPCGDGCLSLQT
jgi:hypothetical protein